MQFMDTPQASIYGPVDGPALLFENVNGGNSMSNVMVHGQSSAVIMRGVSLIRFTDVGLKAAVNADNVDSTKPVRNLVHSCPFHDLTCFWSIYGQFMVFPDPFLWSISGTGLQCGAKLYQRSADRGELVPTLVNTSA